ncbi:MAG TPA: hypothetical protein VFJ13_04825 [Paracoccaceae bacterium]|nr:hypothetical protein [Paracoccaceae bacterium]
MKTFTIAAGVLYVSLAAADARAAVLWSFEETGGGVVGTFSGSLDLTGATEIIGDSVIGFALIGPNTGTVLSGPAWSAGIDVFSASAPASIGTGNFTNASSSTGSPFAVTSSLGGRIGVPERYVSGESLDGTITFGGATFAGLGIAPGSYVWSLPNDTVTLRFGPAAAVIPLPATLPLMLGAFGVAFAVARRRG